MSFGAAAADFRFCVNAPSSEGPGEIGAAIIFSKIFISAPSPVAVEGIGSGNTNAATNDDNTEARDLSRDERRELERFREKERQEEEDRVLVRDMEERMKDDPQGTRMMMTMMMMVQSRDLRKAERELLVCQEECDTVQEILRVTQSDLEEAATELKDLRPKAERLQEELDRLTRAWWEAATHRSEKHKQQITALQDKVDRYKEKLALKTRQLSRRNKDLILKRKLISSHKMELMAAGKEQQRVCKKTQEELQRTKKELELLPELDSLTMGESMTSFGNGSLSWDSRNKYSRVFYVLF
eukprot:scaffold165209_cov46-Attheya_sp.AAC.1